MCYFAPFVDLIVGMSALLWKIKILVRFTYDSRFLG